MCDHAVAEVSNVCLMMPESCEMAQGGNDQSDERSLDTQQQMDSGNAFTLSLSRDHSWETLLYPPSSQTVNDVPQSETSLNVLVLCI
jgi:hypothetical protein